MLLFMDLLVYLLIYVSIGAAMFVVLKFIIEFLKTYIGKIGTGLLNFLTTEWIFKFVPNGGVAVLLRTLFTGSIMSILVLLMYKYSYEYFKNEPCDCVCFFFSHWWKFCGVYAAVYTSFYARFVSQWTYLSNLYNQIKNADMDLCKSCMHNCKNGQSIFMCNSEAKKKLDGWKSGFIEDAETLHMETKSIFAAVIYTWLTTNPNIAENYKKYHAKLIFNQQNSEERLRKLSKKIEKRLKNL